MKSLKKYAKYIIWIVGLYIFTQILIFVGFNLNYKEIQLKESLPSQVVVDKAEATKSQCRIYGKVKNTDSNNLNGKYIKILAYNSQGENVETQFLKIEGLAENEEKAFKSSFQGKDIQSYEINLVNYK